MKIINWSEFEPFNRRLTYDAIQEAIQCGELLISDFKSICSIPIGDYNVYFSELMVADNAPDNFEIPKDLCRSTLMVSHFVFKHLVITIRYLNYLEDQFLFQKYLGIHTVNVLLGYFSKYIMTAFCGNLGYRTL